MFVVFALALFIFLVLCTPSGAHEQLDAPGGKRGKKFVCLLVQLLRERGRGDGRLSEKPCFSCD